MNYQQWVETMQSLLVSDANDSSFDSLIPRIIESAELRILRDFDFLATSSAQTTTLASATRTVALPSNVVVCQALNVITPVSTTNPDLGTRNPVSRVSVDFLNAVYPSSSGAGVPKYYALLGNPTITTTTAVGSINIVLGPFPDLAYTVEVLGTVRPTPLSATNTTTFISVNLPELFVAASMVFAAGAVLQNYGQQSDDPKLAMSWEQQYEMLKAGVMVEELRKKSSSSDWTSYFPTPTANAPRDRVA